MTTRRLTVFRTLAMLASILGILALSRGSTGWAQVAQAQTVPTLTFTPPPTLPATPRPTAILPTDTPGAPPATPAATSLAATGTPSQPTATGSQAPATPATIAPGSPTAVSAELAACGPAPYSLAARAGSAPVLLVLGEGTLTLLASDGLDGQTGNPITVISVGAAIVPTRQLPAAAAGWRLLGCGLRATARDAAGHPPGFLTRGLTVCMLPPPTQSPGTEVRLAYFDSRVDINRWVFLPSRAEAGEMCSSRFHLPATFALLIAAP